MPPFGSSGQPLEDLLSKSQQSGIRREPTQAHQKRVETAGKKRENLRI